MKRIDRIRQLDSSSLAYLLCIDNVGDCRSCCTVCQRFEEDNCDDRCVTGVAEWLESEEEIECDDCPHSYSEDGFFVNCKQVDENKTLKQKLEKIKQAITEPIKTYWEYRKEILQIIEEQTNG